MERRPTGRTWGGGLWYRRVSQGVSRPSLLRERTSLDLRRRDTQRNTKTEEGPTSEVGQRRREDLHGSYKDEEEFPSWVKKVS